MQRTLIEMAPDGHVLITRQQLSKAAAAGNAKQRRQADRAGVEPVWFKTDRAIWRPGKPIPEKAQSYPGVLRLACTNTADTITIQAENEQVRQKHVQQADAIVAGIDAQIAAHVVTPLGLYGHHPDPVIDAQVEMDRLEGLLAEARVRSRV